MYVFTNTEILTLKLLVVGNGVFWKVIKLLGDTPMNGIGAFVKRPKRDPSHFRIMKAQRNSGFCEPNEDAHQTLNLQFDLELPCILNCEK